MDGGFDELTAWVSLGSKELECEVLFVDAETLEVRSTDGIDVPIPVGSFGSVTVARGDRTLLKAQARLVTYAAPTVGEGIFMTLRSPEGEEGLFEAAVMHNRRKAVRVRPDARRPASVSLFSDGLLVGRGGLFDISLSGIAALVPIEAETALCAASELVVVVTLPGIGPVRVLGRVRRRALWGSSQLQYGIEFDRRGPSFRAAEERIQTFVTGRQMDMLRLMRETLDRE